MKAKFYLIGLAVMAALLVACTHNDNEKEFPLPDGVVASVDLPEDVEFCLDQIFMYSNAKLRAFENYNISEDDTKPVYVIQSKKELETICPDKIDVPVIDFSNNCIIYSVISTPATPYEILATELSFKNDVNTFYFAVDIQKCSECWTTSGHLYPYGVYPFPARRIKYIELIVTYQE